VKEKVIAVMPIKMNNERMPGKNIRLLGDRPLLQYELLNLKETGLLERIYLYCSNEEIIKYLPDGIVFSKRPTYLDLPASNFSQIFAEFSAQYEADIYVYAHATAPFVTVKTIRECILAVQSGNYDSAFCAEEIMDFLWQDVKPLNFNAQNLPRSQDLPPIYRETSGVYVFTKEVFEKYHTRIGKRPFIKIVSYKEAVDINDYEDFMLAERLLNMNEGACNV